MIKTLSPPYASRQTVRRMGSTYPGTGRPARLVARKLRSLWFVVLLVAAVIGCEGNNEQLDKAARQLDNAKGEMKDAIDNAGEALEDAAADAKDAMTDASRDAKNAIEDASESAKDAIDDAAAKAKEGIDGAAGGDQ